MNVKIKTLKLMFGHLDDFPDANEELNIASRLLESSVFAEMFISSWSLM